MLLKRATIALIAVSMIAGCSGARYTPTSIEGHLTNALPRMSDSEMLARGLIGGMATPARPFVWGRDRLGRDSTASLNRNIRIKGRRSFPPLTTEQGGRRALSVLEQDDDGGQAGTTVLASYNYSSISANQTAWSNYVPNSGDILYSPTMKIPGSGCLEGTTIYGYGTPSMGWWDFCIPNNDQFYASKMMTSFFVSTYVRDLGDGVPMYSAEIVEDPANPSAWHGLLYNYTTKIWEDIYDDSGNGEINGGQGWSMFETHYHNVGETCKQTPWMESDDISLNGSHVNTTETQFFDWGDCFNDPNTGTNPYVLDQIAANYHWLVDIPTEATPKPPTPTPYPTPTSTPCTVHNCPPPTPTPQPEQSNTPVPESTISPGE